MDKKDENYIYYVIGKNLKKQRKAKGLTQEKLADKSDFALSFIGNLESEKVFQTLSVGSVYHLAKTLDIHITELFKDLTEEDIKSDED